MTNPKKHIAVWLAALLLAGPAALTNATPVSPGAADAAADQSLAAALASIRPEALRANIRFLADDLLEGRGTATRGHELAAKFMAAQFENMGLEPAGDQGAYFQNVPLRSFQPDESRTTFSISRAGKVEKLVFRKDYIASGDPARADISVQAPVVYVGFGVTAPEQSYDDYQGLDVRGKIVALVSQAPNFETSLRAHYSSYEMKEANAVAHGAVGIIRVDDPVREGIYSFQEQVRDLSFPSLRWLDPQGRPNDYFPELRGDVTLSLTAVEQFFAGSAHTAKEVFAASKAGKKMSFPLPFTATIHEVTRLQDTRSPNVAAKLRGSDPVLREEYVVYSAHVDHLGIGEPVKGDKIYNGALDNASGSAAVLEIARAFSRMNPRPRRSILFIAVTGEEAGLLGSDYFARYPTVPKTSLVANVNLDEDLMLWPLQDLVVYGAEHSSLGAVAQQAARRLHLEISPDTQPEQVIFIRSDHYSFVKQGVPAIFPEAGVKSSDPAINAKEREAAWQRDIYHQPQDDMNQAFDFEAGAQFARFGFLCGYLIAQATERPTWNSGDFFGERYAKKNPT
jgi:hypothetical protein